MRSRAWPIVSWVCRYMMRKQNDWSWSLKCSSLSSRRMRWAFQNSASLMVSSRGWRLGESSHLRIVCRRPYPGRLLKPGKTSMIFFSISLPSNQEDDLLLHELYPGAALVINLPGPGRNPFCRRQPSRPADAEVNDGWAVEAGLGTFSARRVGDAFGNAGVIEGFLEDIAHPAQVQWRRKAQAPSTPTPPRSARLLSSEAAVHM